MHQIARTTRRKLRAALCVVTMTCVSALASLPMSAGGIPDTPTSIAKADNEGPAPRFLERRDPDTGEPLWVSAEAATGPDGQIDWSLLGEKARQAFDRFSQSPPIPYSVLERSPGTREMSTVAQEVKPSGETTLWYHYGFNSVDTPMGERWGTLEELALKATVIYEGKVIGLSEGFFDGSPATLLTIRIESSLRSQGGHKAEGEVYLYYPEAKFSIGELNFWKSNPLYPPRPSLGDSLIIADDRPPADFEGSTVLPNPDGIFIESRTGGQPHVKSSMNSLSDRPLHFNVLASRLRELTQANGNKR